MSKKGCLSFALFIASISFNLSAHADCNAQYDACLQMKLQDICDNSCKSYEDKSALIACLEQCKSKGLIAFCEAGFNSCAKSQNK